MGPRVRGTRVRGDQGGRRCWVGGGPTRKAVDDHGGKRESQR